MSQTANYYLQSWFANADRVTSAPLVMDVGHANVHSGIAYTAEHAFATLANAGTARYVIATGSVAPHFVFGIDAGGAVRVSFYEDSTYTGGTALGTYNFNRFSSKTPTMAIYHSPTAGTAGTVALINARYLAGGATPQTRVGGGLRTSNEFVLGTSRTYMLDIVNVSGGAIVAGAIFEWYEEAAYG